MDVSYKDVSGRIGPFLDWVRQFSTLLRSGLPLPEVAGQPPLAREGVPTVLHLAPHPDDEAINGALAHRLRTEAGMQIVVVALSYGRHHERQAARRREMAASCALLDFALEGSQENGSPDFGAIDLGIRSESPAAWRKQVAALAALVARYRPRLVIAPHAADRHPAHEGVHQLMLDALSEQEDGFETAVALWEYWQPMAAPNLLLGMTEESVAHLLAAVSCHAGEVARNPYHLTLPAWMADNVRRGGEVVGARGGAAPAFVFGSLYEWGRFRGGRYVASELKRIIAPDASILEALGI